MMGKINTWERKMKKIDYHECYDNNDDDDHDDGNIDGDDDDNGVNDDDNEDDDDIDLILLIRKHLSSQCLVVWQCLLSAFTTP